MFTNNCSSSVPSASSPEDEGIIVDEKNNKEKKQYKIAIFAPYTTNSQVDKYHFFSISALHSDNRNLFFHNEIMKMPSITTGTLQQASGRGIDEIRS